MTICRSVSMQTAHHSVSNVVALPSLPPPQHPLLAVASLCQQASWTAPSEQVPVIGDGESEKLVSYPPKCISDGESTVITQTADPSKQCSAGVQTQIDSDTSANGFSPACFGSPTLPGCDERERDSGLFWAGSTKEPAATQTDSQTDSRTDSPTTGPPRAERFLTPLVVEADSIGECLTSPVPQISSSNEECSAETTIVPDKPNELDLSGLELLYKSIEHMESMETKRTPHGEALAQDDDKVLAAAPNPEPSGLGGLGLLCALAEQRIQEELEDAPRRPEPDRGAPTPTPRPTADVNRNYRTPQSEKDVRRYLATRAEASHASPVAVSLTLTPKNDSVEMEIQNRLAELKRAYKETQRELSRLTPRKNSTECESSCGSHNGSPHSKRVPAKSSLTRKKKAAAKKKTPHKSENSSDPPPPILERVTDVCEAPLPKLKWSRLDAPPTLTPHKPPSEHSNGQRASFKLNLVKLPATKDHKRRWSVDSPSARISTETQHADDEDSDGLWPEFSSKHFEARHRRNKGPSDTSSLYSSSKRRKVGRPKRHLDKAGNGYHATETIVPKQPKNKANLVSFLLASKSAGAPGKFPSNEHRPSENSCSSPEHRPKIRPKLKAEVKVKETWEDEDILDWSTPKPQLPSHPLRPLDLVFECTEEISSNGHEKSLDLKRRVGHEDDIGDAEWLPSPKKAKMPATLLKPIVVPSFIQSKISEKTLPIVKPRRPANVAKERRQSTEKLHLKKPVCSSSEELMPAKVSCDPESCILTAEILDSAGLPIRTLTAQGGLFYAGLLNAVTPPDLYSIALHGERASRLNIYSREEILQDTILEVRPLNVETLHIGTRLCAYWSQQTRCLYPGVVVPPSTPDPTLDGDFVTVEFDDGDSGQIRIQDIRLLPPNYPVVEFDPNPLLSLTKRKRRNSEKSSDSKDRRVSADSALSPSTSNHENQKEDDVKNLSQAESSDNLADAKQPFELSAPSTFRNSPSPYKRRLSTQLIENESKRLKKRRRDKLKRLMTASAAADARKHKHKHKHKHRHRRSSSGSSSDAVSQTEMDVHLPLEEKNRSDPIQEPLSPISGKGEIKQLKEEEEEEKEVLKEEGKKDEYVSKEEELQEDVKMESCDPQTTIKESQPTDLPKSEDTSILANESQSQGKRPKKKHDRQNSTETSKMAAFLPPRQLWDWSGKGYKRQGGKGRKKEFYKCIQRGSEQITVGDCAVFLSTNSPDRPYIGRIESLWEIYNGMMVVRVKWFYHPEETEGCPSLKYPGGLFQSDHADDNDVQTISHRCEVLSISDYEKRVNQSPGHLAQIQDVYYLAGFYDPKNILIKMEKGVPV